MGKPVGMLMEQQENGTAQNESIGEHMLGLVLARGAARMCDTPPNALGTSHVPMARSSRSFAHTLALERWHVSERLLQIAS